MKLSNQIHPATHPRLLAPIFIALALLSYSSAAPAQQCCGDADSPFTGYYGANARVRASVRQPNDQVILGGDFTSYGGATYRNYLARINSDGSVDYSFTPFVSGAVYGLALQPEDGKIIAVGALGNVGGPPAYGIARFHSNGYLDTSFTSPVLDYYPTVVELQDNGKILIGGSFTTVNNQWCPRIARLLSDGTRDSTFTSPVPNGLVYTIKSFGGFVFIGGTFTMVGSAPCGRIARLFDGGGVDSGFGVPGANDAVRSIEIGGTPGVIRLLVGGDFTSMHGSNAPYFARLIWGSGSFDGALTSPPDGAVNVIRVLPVVDPSIASDFLIGGKFSNLGTHSSRCFARIIGANLGISPCLVVSGFTGGDAQGTSVDTLSVFPPQPPAKAKTFAGGNFTSYNGHAWNRVAKFLIELPCD